MKVYDVPIHRRTEREALQAISDLIDRGYEVIYPLTEKKSSTTYKGSYNHMKGRFTSREGSVHSVWYAKVRKVITP